MALDLGAPLTQLVTLVKSIAGLADETDGTAHVHTGVPASFGPRVSAFVALQPRRVGDRATQTRDLQVAYFVGFGYRTADAAPTAETALATYVGSFIVLMSQASNRDLGGLVATTDLEFPSGDSPQYEIVAGQEFRTCPILVVATFRFTF